MNDIFKNGYFLISGDELATKEKKVCKERQNKAILWKGK